MSAATHTDAVLKMRCPMARESERNCVGKNCMAWRWVNTSASVPVKIENGATVYEIKATHTHGYCGLAGVVQ